MATSLDNLTLYRYKRTNKAYVEDLGHGVSMSVPTLEPLHQGLEGNVANLVAHSVPALCQGTKRHRHILTNLVRIAIGLALIS